MAIQIRQRSLVQALDYQLPEGHSEIRLLQKYTMSNGFLNRYGIRDGMELLVFDFTVEEQVEERVIAPGGLLLAYVVKGDGQIALWPRGSEHPKAITYRKDLSIIAKSREPMEAHSSIRPSMPFCGVEIRLDGAFLQRSGIEAMLDDLDETHPWSLLSGEGIWIGERETPGQIDEFVQLVLASAGSSVQDDFVIEARALDMLRLTLGALKPNGPSSTRAQIKSQSLKQKVEEVKHLLQTDLTRPWAIKTLAREVGLSEKKLQQEFKRLSGLSVYRYLQKTRLEEAHMLITERGLSVTESAFRVGYSNPSRFSELFKRQFGIRPSELWQSGQTD